VQDMGTVTIVWRREVQKCTSSIPPISRVNRDGKGRRKMVCKASKVDVSIGSMRDSTDIALTLLKTKGSLLLLEQ